jgi:hypothetical protein
MTVLAKITLLVLVLSLVGWLASPRRPRPQRDRHAPPARTDRSQRATVAETCSGLPIVSV